ncbi:MAG: tetratricopeptide repeat protein, partial [Woeseiaceae bacterium]
MNKFRQVLIGLGCTCALFLAAACQPTPEERLASAEQYLADGDYRTATIELRNLLQAAPDDSRARLLLARTSYQLGDFSDAISQYERAIGLGETEPETWVAFGRALLSQGRAIDAFERVVPNVDAADGDEAILVFLGDVQFSMNNMERADSYYQQVLSANPMSVDGLIGRAMVMANAGDLQEAQKVLDSALAIDAQASSVWLARGRIYQADGRFEDAATAYDNAIQLQTPHTPLAESFSARVSYVSSLIDSQQLDLAATQLAALIDRFPDHPVSGFLSGRLAFAQGDYDNAQLALQDYLSSNPGDARGQAILGAITFSQDNLRQAESHLIAAVRANAGGDATRRLLAETRLRLNDPEGALDVLRSIYAVGQLDTAYLSMLGRAQVAAGDDQAAIDYFRQGVAQSPDDDTVRLALAATYLKTNQAE